MDTETGTATQDGYPRDTIERLTASWATRSTVRCGAFDEALSLRPVDELSDFPPALIPFASHPDYECQDDRLHRKAEALAWVAWNRRVVDNEELIVAPALASLLSGTSGLTLHGIDGLAVRQIVVDEYFHSYMHEHAMAATRRRFDLSPATLQRRTYSYRSYLAAAEGFGPGWQAEVALLAWMVVVELSINEYISIISRSSEIPEVNRRILLLHERDEGAHSVLVAEIARRQFARLDPKSRACFTACIPLAVAAFAKEDWQVWEDVLREAGIDRASSIVCEVQRDWETATQPRFFRSFGAVVDLTEELDLHLLEELRPYG